ncbi:MAG: nucleoside hydrolase [Actinomycetota bacterium]|jgi:purine nucleosidase|nr:nucleoside hydrolase [Actinomycetota bacterium]MEC8486582.1 nucleoside hydrolase [Actinomycetota bacterium]MEC8521852.1 nucleoside hydrolase [Actinomycetota bacterium]MEC9224270.1 nucleoside hydrolase [Actinomycetota bacterium]MED5297691.1 nucleoside hydrolase [Actinomycetota bacterium]
MSTLRPFFIDTDTASDDAVALVMAFARKDINIVGIGVVAGNVPLSSALQNALYTRELCGRTDVPVYAGADRPLIFELGTAQHVHGDDGMGDIGLPLTGRAPNEGHAVDALLEASNEHAGELTLVTLGPLTNIALAIQRDPSIADKISRVVLMGAAADHIGNVNPVAEFNMWVDPHAVQIVLESGLPLEFVGWDISRRDAVIVPEEANRLRSIGTPRAEFIIDIQRIVAEFCARDTKLAGFDMPDPIAMAYAIDPSIATQTRHLNLVIECTEGPTRGMVVMDLLGLTGRDPNAVVVVHADPSAFIRQLEAAIS